MSEQAAKDEGTGRTWRKPREPMPWGKFWWRDWLASADARRLTHEQRGRFLDVWCYTQSTDTPGIMTEEDVRTWAGYAPAEWRKVRSTFARLFDLRAKRGRWVLEAVLESHRAAIESARMTHERAQKAVAGRQRVRKELATTSTTPSAPADAPQVPLQVQLQVDTDADADADADADVRLRQPDSTDKTEADSEAATDARAQTTRSRAGSAGEAGASRPSVLAPIVARALGEQPQRRSERGSA